MWLCDRDRFVTTTLLGALLYTRGFGCRHTSPQRPNRIDRKVWLRGAPASAARGWKCNQSQSFGNAMDAKRGLASQRPIVPCAILTHLSLPGWPPPQQVPPPGSAWECAFESQLKASGAGLESWHMRLRLRQGHFRLFVSRVLVPLV
jgi:hypothetical protein